MQFPKKFTAKVDLGFPFLRPVKVPMRYNGIEWDEAGHISVNITAPRWGWWYILLQIKIAQALCVVWYGGINELDS